MRATRKLQTLLAFLIAILWVWGAPAYGKEGPDGPADLAVNQELFEALERDGEARIEVTLDLSAELSTDLKHPAVGSGVHPVVFDLAMMSAQGPMRLEQAGDFHLLQIAARADAVGKILEIKEVLTVRLDSNPPEPALPVKNGSPCVPSSTRACVQPGFSTSVNYGGVVGRVAVVGGSSATFWAYDSNNWEVLTKVLDGCGINNHWWLFAAAAGTNSYQVGSTIWVQGGSLPLGSWSALNEPIVNLQLFNCGG